MMKWQIVEDENIADLKVEVFGKTKQELLENLIQLFSFLICQDRNFDEKITITEKIKGKNFKELVFDLVERLIYFKDARGLIFKKGEFKIGKRELRVKLKGDKIRSNWEQKTDIKALTRHKFEVKKDKVYKATLVFDV